MSSQDKRVIAGYIRVSSEDQAKGNSLEQQAERLRRDGVDKIYSDVESGANSERPGFNRLMDDISRGKIAVLKATRWDRLTRSQEKYFLLKALIKQSNAKLIILDQGGEQNLETAAGELNAEIHVVFAAFERNMLRERVRHGFAHRRSKVVAWSRPPLFYDIVNDKYVLNRTPIVCSLQDRPDNYFDYDGNSLEEKLIRGQSKADIAHEIIDYLLEVRKYRKVLSHFHHRYTMEKLNNPTLAVGLAMFNSSKGLKNWLRNPVLRGHTAYLKYDESRIEKDPEKWEIHQDTHPEHRVITEEQYEDIKEITVSNSKKFGKTDATFYLTGLIYCDQCKSRCVFKRGGDYAYYGCRYSNVSCSNRKCVRLGKIEQAIISALTNQANVIAQSSDCKSVKSDKLIKLEAKLKHLESFPDADFDADIRDMRNRILKEIEAEKKELRNTAWEILSHPQARIINFWYTLTQEHREVLYEKLVERVIILGSQVVSVTLKV